MKTLKGRIRFVGRYISEPYWPERAQLIDIDKQSGVSRARSEASRVKALDAHLKKLGMTLDDLERLKAQAERPFWTVADLPQQQINGHDISEIIIPGELWLACFAHGCDVAPAAVRIAKPENVRSVIQVDVVYTGRLGPDGTWTRAVVPKKDGKALSNQRGMRTSFYIANVEAAIVIHYSETVVTEKRLRDFVEYVGREVGIGASRKMNCGRFTCLWD